MQGGCPERVEVAGHVDLSGELLGRHVTHRAHHGGVLQRAVEIPRHSEIDQRDLSVVPPDEVRRLEVPVDDRGLESMEVAQDLQHFLDQVEDFVFRISALLQLLKQRDTVEVAIREVQPRSRTFLLAEGVDVDGHSRMAELAEGPRLAREGLQRLSVGSIREAQLLDDHLPAVGRSGEEGAPPAAAPERSQDQERAGQRRGPTRFAATAGERRIAENAGARPCEGHRLR